MTDRLDQLARQTAPSASAAADAAKAVAEVAAAVRAAQDNPRDVHRCVEQMRQACRQPSLAERAFYSLPRAGGRVEGSTVHLARELASCWGNFDFGLRELARDDVAGQSEVLAWAWDQERNTRSSRSFIVPHARMAKKERQPLIDLGDIANNNNSVGSRAQREVIFTILPRWFRDEAEALCAQTLQDGGGRTVEQQVADILAGFRERVGVTQRQLEERLQRAAKDWTVQDLGVLRVIAGELSRGEKRVQDEFPIGEAAELADLPSRQAEGASGDGAAATSRGDRARREDAPSAAPSQSPAPAAPAGDAPRPASGAQVRMVLSMLTSRGVQKGDTEEALLILSKLSSRALPTVDAMTGAEADHALAELRKCEDRAALDLLLDELDAAAEANA